MSDQRTGSCRICGRTDVDVTQVPGRPGDVCIDEVACFIEFRRREGWDAVGRLVLTATIIHAGEGSAP